MAPGPYPPGRQECHATEQASPRTMLHQSYVKPVRICQYSLSAEDDKAGPNRAPKPSTPNRLTGEDSKTEA